jgi:hypothetical protein
MFSAVEVFCSQPTSDGSAPISRAIFSRASSITGKYFGSLNTPCVLCSSQYRASASNPGLDIGVHAAWFK